MLTDLGAPIRAVGGVCLILGATFIAVGGRGIGSAVMPTLIGGVVAIAGLLMVVLPSRVTAAFDRPGRTLVITRRGITGRKQTRDEVDLSKISGVEAAESTGLARPGQTASGTGMFRVEIVLRDGARVPLTSYYSNSPTHATAAAAARAFLGLAPPAPAVGAASPVLPSAERRVPRSSLVFMAVLCSAFVALGAWLFLTEGRRLSNARPVPATVLATDVRSVRSTGRGGTTVTLKPVVLFRYNINGREYTADRVTPLNESRSGQWAYKLIARYPVGATVTAWFDPAHPEQAFLLHEWSLPPLFFVVFPLLLLGLMTFMVLRARRTAAAKSAGGS